MNRKIILISAVLAFMTLMVGYNSAFAIDPAKKPQRPDTTQQTKPKQKSKSQQQSQSKKRSQTKQQTQEQTQSKQCVSGTKTGHDYVDLGLSVKWATCNIGANSPSDYGNYYAWGETSTKASYTGDNSKWYGVSYDDLQSRGVINSNGNLCAQYDAATQNWGSSWRMPTRDEIDELLGQCTWSRTTENGHKGYRVKGPNGNTIFLPAAGIRDGSNLGSAGKMGFFWSSTAYRNSQLADYLTLYSSDYYSTSSSRYFGDSVRPVTE